MIGAFLAWWLGQLSALLPGWLRAAGSRPADALLIAPAGALDNAGSCVATLRRRGREMLLGHFMPGSEELRELPVRLGVPVALRLSKREVLEKTLSLPLAAEAELDQVLAFEMDRETPFAPDELYWNHRIETVDRQRRQLEVRLTLLPKVRIAPLMAALAKVGIAPTVAEIGDEDEAALVLPLDDGGGAHRSGRSRRLVWVPSACLLLLAVAAAAIPFVRQAAALAALDREIGAARQEAQQAEALRQQIDRLSRSADLVRSELSKAGRPLEVLVALTGILPDDSYLTEFDLRQRKVTLSGRSAHASGLIGALAAGSRFRNPTFTAPVTRLEAAQVEVFTIVAELGSTW